MRNSLRCAIIEPRPYLSNAFTERVGFEDFCAICKKEPITTADDLMKAFKKIDMNGDGFISHSELKKVMTTVSLSLCQCDMVSKLQASSLTWLTAN